MSKVPAKSTQPPLQALVNYYARGGLWRHIQSACNEQLKLKSGDPSIVFWKAFGLMKEGQASEAIRELETIQTKTDCKLAATAVLLAAHKTSRLQDAEAIASLQQKLGQHKQGSTSNSTDLLLVSNFYMLTGEYDVARGYVQEVIDQRPNFVPAQVLRGWIDLLCGKEKYVKRCQTFFDAVLNSGEPASRDLEALMGRAKVFEMQAKYTKCLDIINQVVVWYPIFLPAFNEKARVLLMMGEWDLALETTQRVLAADNYNSEAWIIVLLHYLTRDTQSKQSQQTEYSVAANRIGDLVYALDKFEPANAALYYALSRPLCRLADRNKAVLQQTLILMERAMTLEADNSEYITECAVQHSLLGDLKKAKELFQQAMKLSETNTNALVGLIKCHIMEGDLDYAEQQLEFLDEILQSIGKGPQVLYLNGLLAWKKHRNVKKFIRLLTNALEIHFRDLENAPLSPDYFVRLNPDFLLELASGFLQHCPSEPMDPSDPPSEVLSKAIKLLEIISKAVPGHLECLYLLAKCRYVCNDSPNAQLCLHTCLKLNPAHACAHLLMASIHLSEERYPQSAQELEQALSHDFRVREGVTYHLVKARFHEKMAEYEDALKILQAAVALPGVRPERAGKGDPQRVKRVAVVSISDYDKASVFLALASVYARLERHAEAQEVMDLATTLTSGTEEELRITTARAQLVLDRGDVDAAINLLKAVAAGKSYYIKSQTVLANIYLQRRNDRRMYARTYRNLVESSPSVHTLFLLGDAFMRIQEPEKAIKVYEGALKQNPKDAQLSKIGKALITTHDYAKAIEYYCSAVKVDPTKTLLRYELCELYTKLRKWTDAEKALLDALKGSEDVQSVSAMIEVVQFYLLLAQVYRGSDNKQGAADVLMKARDMQTRILGRMKGEQPSVVREQKSAAANVCFNLAEYYNQLAHAERAQSFYNEALKHDDSHEKSILALAKLHLSRGELDPCQQQCISLLRMDSSNEEATIMLADLMFRKNDYEAATFHFQQLLEKKPNHYSALERLIMLLRRAGKLADVPRFLKLAENLSSRANLEPGLHFCKGLYHRHTNSPADALTEFYCARKDGEWGVAALENMIELYVLPENENASAEDKTQDINSATELFKELPTPLSHRQKVLNCYISMASKQKAGVEKAMADLNTVMADQREAVSPLLAMSHAHMALKQAPKARNYLKRISKLNYNSDDAEEFERSWLLLAEIYIQGGKYDLALDLLKRCLKHNKSCSRAWERTGFILEKEQSYRDAADHYEMAWKMENMTNAAVGFKLAFNYLKAKRFVEAIDICHHVLAAQPEYPKIKKEILDRARSSLRP